MGTRHAIFQITTKTCQGNVRDRVWCFLGPSLGLSKVAPIPLPLGRLRRGATPGVIQQARVYVHLVVSRSSWGCSAGVPHCLQCSKRSAARPAQRLSFVCLGNFLGPPRPLCRAQAEALKQRAKVCAIGNHSACRGGWQGCSPCERRRQQLHHHQERQRVHRRCQTATHNATRHP